MSVLRDLQFVVLLAALVAVGCGSGPSDGSFDQATGNNIPRPEGTMSRSDVREAELRELLQPLLPDGVEIAGPYVGDCSETLPNPNCISINLMWQGMPHEARQEIVTELAEANGWRQAGASSLTGADFVYFERTGYTLYLAVFRQELYPNCEPPGERLTSPCRDVVRIYLAR